MDEKKIQTSIVIIAAISLSLLCVLIYFSPEKRIYDEGAFIRNNILFDELGLSKKFLYEMGGQSPGPLYQLVHYISKPLTNYDLPQSRFVSFICLILLMIFTWFTSRIMKLDHPFIITLNTMSIPPIIIVSGLALTEMPALMLAGLFLLLQCFTWQKKDQPLWESVSISAIGGICLGLAILGRSPFLAVCLALPILLYPNILKFNDLLKVIIPGFFALVITLPVFVIWGGLVPPKVANIEIGIAPIHLISAFAYTGVFTMIIAPRFFISNKYFLLLLLMGLLICCSINFTIWKINFAPFITICNRFLPEIFVNLYGLFITSVLFVCGFYFIISSLIRLWENRDNSFYLFASVATILILATNLKIAHGFTFRYVAQAIPFLVIMLAPYDKLTAAKPLRYGFGSIIGMLYLIQYYYIYD